MKSYIDRLPSNKWGILAFIMIGILTCGISVIMCTPEYLENDG